MPRQAESHPFRRYEAIAQRHPKSDNETVQVGQVKTSKRAAAIEAARELAKELEITTAEAWELVA